MNQFTIYRGHPDVRNSKALEFNGNSHAVRFSASKSIAITSLGFYRPSMPENPGSGFINAGPATVRVLLLMMESPTLNQDMAVHRQPSQYLDQTAFDVVIDDQLGELVFNCNLETAVLIPKNTVIEVYFTLMVHGSPNAKFLRLPDEHPIFCKRLERLSQTEFTFLASSKQLASIGFSLLHEVWGSGAVYLEDGRTIFYKRELHDLEQGVYLEDDEGAMGFDWERNNNANIRPISIVVEEDPGNQHLMQLAHVDANTFHLPGILRRMMCAIL